MHTKITFDFYSQNAAIFELLIFTHMAN